MRFIDAILELSASDISRFLSCRHRTGLDLAVALGQRSPPHWVDPLMQLLSERGLEHEQHYADELRAQGLETVDLAGHPGLSGVEPTLQAMRRGVPVILQGSLRVGHWFGRPDVLRRIGHPGAFGAWSYEVVDTKLALETRGATVVQLVLYCQLLGMVQDYLPEFFHVVTPDVRSPVQSFRVHDFAAYFRLIQAQLDRTTVLAPSAITAANYPEPVEYCEACHWWRDCERRRREDDHLGFVAGVSRLQRRELEASGVRTLAQLAALPVPLAFKPRRGAAETYVRARNQARVQLEGRTTCRPVHELLPVEAGKGLARLPEPSVGDVFLDLEGDPFAGEGGREYLFGLLIVEQDGSLRPLSLWAWSASEERAAFEAVVDEIERLWGANPGMHVYHYAPYEPAAFKRLMGRYATREAAIDRLLRAERFVDLHSVVRHALRASVERYSIKDLEPFFDFEREVPLEQARRNMRLIERAVELRMPEAADEAARQAVQGYNLDDCHSARRLRDWLEQLRDAAIVAGTAISRPDAKPGADPEKVDARSQQVQARVATLTSDVPIERSERSGAQQARWVLAHLLDYHRRENKAPFWEFFRLKELPAEELLDERGAVSGLEFLARVGGTAKCPIDRYGYPLQDTDVRPKDDLHIQDGTKFGTVEAIDRAARTIDVRKVARHAATHPVAAFAFSVVNKDVLADALMRIADDVIAYGIDGGGDHRAARALLLGQPPRLFRERFAQRPTESAVEFAVRLAPLLDSTVLPIQGPPGAGKTFTGAHMICELVRRGRKVGITAVSHKVIRNLLEAALKAAGASNLALHCIQKVNETGVPSPAGITEVTDNSAVVDGLSAGANVVGATAWLWARADLKDAVDVLFVDEAGQMCLADVLATSQAARSLVLLGDPQQLEQPQQGSHPDGTGVSALEHLLQGHQTVPGERGIFLPETWRLPPNICRFTSEVFYENRLHSLAGLEAQALCGTQPVCGNGLWVLPVEHEGNQNASAEEVEAIEDLIARLLAGGGTWVDRMGKATRLTPTDILVIAPYNAQVGLLSERLDLRGVRVGTVDKFQGQQAPVVIYSMGTSTPEDAPRGMEFLYSLNRLNVATSRAQCVCILVANPRLFAPDCRTPRQMQLANALCRYLEMATRLSGSAAEASGGTDAP
ncbi:MAG TPA: TM0106 family RecB-like putative nuclease [Steroidobacteraceae bacterium]|nr:TM0106 family RecB-like putative nuclease [Steroidobacteraceae bacterium]